MHVLVYLYVCERECIYVATGNKNKLFALHTINILTYTYTGIVTHIHKSVSPLYPKINIYCCCLHVKMRMNV